jgi:hypothetical protein
MHENIPLMNELPPTPVPGPAGDVPVPVPTTPVSVMRQRPRWRWLVALFTTAFLLVGTIGIAGFAQIGRAGAGVSPDFLPENTIAYGESRLDLPGDQRDQLAAFLAHFPGFSDPGAFGIKLDQALDAFVSMATNGELSYTEDVQPWADRSAAFGIPALPADLSGREQPPVVVAFGVTDRAALESRLSNVIERFEVPTTTEDYNGTTITQFGEGSDEIGALAVTDPYLLIATSPDVLRGSLDVIAGTTPALSADPDYQAATSTLPADRLGAVYLDTAQLKPLIEQSMSDTEMMGMDLGGMLDLLPNAVAAALRAESDHLGLDAVVVPGPATPAVAVRETQLASRFPAETTVYLEVRDVGATFRNLITQIKAQIEPTLDDETRADLEQVERILGTPLESYLDFLEDAAIGVGHGENTINLGLIATVSDEVVAQERVSQVVGQLRLAAASSDAPITVTQSDVNGVTVTTVAIDPVAAGLPSDLPIQPQLELATGDGLVLLGIGDFVTQALQRDPATSLASNPRYSAAVSAAGTPNAGVVWLDMASTIELVETFIPEDERAAYETNVKPFLAPLDSFVAATTVTDTGAILGRTLLYVR